MEDYHKLIEVNPKIMFGKPVIKGTRLTVELILEELSSGKTPSDIVAVFPTLSIEAIWAALAFAADALKGEKYIQ